MPIKMCTFESSITGKVSIRLFHFVWIFRLFLLGDFVNMFFVFSLSSSNMVVFQTSGDVYTNTILWYPKNERHCYHSKLFKLSDNYMY